MRILWITNTIFPAVCKKLNLPEPVVGGWMYSQAESLLDIGCDIDLGIATLYQGKDILDFEINGISYFLIPQDGKKQKYQKSLESSWKKINDIYQPDLVHIHGSEYPHGLAYVNSCGSTNVVVSIQGLVSVYERNYYGSISESLLLKSLSLRDIVRFDSIFQQRRAMQQRAVYEKKLLEKVNHVIGRTGWDKTHAFSIKPDIIYHFCNETLRNEFYNGKWEQKYCEKHSIFLSQAHYPIKGLHQMLKALPLILREYPDTIVYVAGNDFFTNGNKFRNNGYGNYIRSLMKKYKLNDKLIFTGILNEHEMVERYLKSNVFVCPSSIENSPNSVGEAQLLGVPVVSSYVGGVLDMIDHGKTGLIYRFNEHEMLAWEVCKYFKNEKFADEVSLKARSVAFQRHSKENNTNGLIKIYHNICEK